MKKYFFLLMLSARCYAQVLTPDEKGNTLLLLDVPSATKVNADLATKFSITNIAQSLASDSSNEVVSVAAVNSHLTNGTSSLTISNLTVTGSAVLPSPLVTSNLQATTVSGSAFADMKTYMLTGQGVTYSGLTGLAYTAPKITTSGGVNGLYQVQKNTTNVSFNIFFGIDTTTQSPSNGVSFSLDQWAFYSDGTVYYDAGSRINVSYTGLYTNTLINFPLPSVMQTNDAMMVRLVLHTNSLGTLPTNGIYYTCPKGYLK